MSAASYTLIRAVLCGALAPDQVPPEVLDKDAQAILTVVRGLAKQGVTNVSLDAVKLGLLAMGKLVPDWLTDSIYEPDPSLAGVFQSLTQRRALVEIMNEAGKQLRAESPSFLRLQDLVAQATSQVQTDELEPIQRIMDKTIDHTGVALPQLSALTDASGGLSGLWVIGGMAGVGKSTLALQIALIYAQSGPVLYFDCENGEAAIVERVRDMVTYLQDGPTALSQLYVRHSIASLDSDLARWPKVLVVIDSLQTLPTQADLRREGMAQWVNRFNTIKRLGHPVILVSELNRANYGVPSQAAYKETGEIEYRADLGIQLIERGGVVELHIVKNRHYPVKGLVCYLERISPWWLQEVTVT